MKYTAFCEEKIETVQNVKKIQQVYLLAKYIKCSCWEVVVCPSYI